MKLTKSVKKLLITSVIAAVIPLALSYIIQYDIIEQYVDTFENALYDNSYKWFMNDTYEETNLADIESRIVFVDIDEVALAKLGPYWQWPRTHHAEVVKRLSQGGAAAITFDILFKKAFFGEKKTDNAIHMLKNVLPSISWDEYYNQIRPFYNDDSVFVNEVKKAKNVIAAATVGLSESYLHASQWKPLSTPQWADSISPNSAYMTAQNFRFITWDILDNIFPALGQASNKIGLVNVLPDRDGIHRSEALLHGFPNPEIDISYRTGWYPVIALQTALILTGNDISSISVKPGEYIDIGKPFSIYKDSSGILHTSYPNLTWPMMRSFMKHKDALKAKLKDKSDFTQITASSQFVLSHSIDEGLKAEIFDAQTLTNEMIKAIASNTDIIEIINTPDGSEIALNPSVTLSWDESEDKYMLTDSEDEEVYINEFVVTIIKENISIIDSIAPGEVVHLACNLDFARHKYHRNLRSNFIALNESVVSELVTKDLSDFEKIAPGDTVGFGKNIKIPIDEQSRMRINYSHFSRNRYVGRSNRGFATISYYDIVSGKIDPGYFQGKVFVLGSSAPALMDIVSAPPSGNFPGVLIHMNMLENIMNNSYMRYISSDTLLALMFLCSIIVTFIASYLRPIFAAIIMIVISLTLFLYNLETMVTGLYLALAQPFIVLGTSFLGTIILRYVFEEREKKQAVEAFKSYISPELIDEMLANDQKPSLGGEENFLTAYFTDIASFSTFSEKIGSPTKLVELLNEYLTAMTNILLEKEGTLDKYEGDAIIAFFGAPVRFENHAQLACEAALEMQKKLGELRELWTSQGDKWPTIVHDMRMRIGINSGQIVTGNMGSSVRMNYTMMGDSVNLAARLESGAKQYGVFTMCSQETLDATDGDILSRAIDVVKVMGKSDPVVTYELLDKIDTAPEELTILCEKFTEARSLYNQTKWAEAEKLFTECLDLEPHHPDRAGGCKTTPSHVYIERCQEYAVNPPVPEGEVWDGVYTATEK